METLEIQTAFEDLLTESQSCPQEFPASQLPLPGSEEARKMTVGSGRQLSMLLDSSSLLGAFSKILLESPRFTNSEEFCHVWMVWDTSFECSAFKLTPLEPNTAENESSLLPTPKATDDKQGWNKTHRSTPEQTTKAGENLKEAVIRLWRTPNAAMVSGGAQDGERRLSSGHALQLTDQAMTPKLWPTPSAGNFNDGESVETWEERRQKNKEKGINGNGQGMPLAIAAKLWPTPRAKKITGKDREDFSPSLHNFVGQSETSGSLNPRFVEQLMGFPIDHTALSPLATASFRSKRSRSSKRSGKSK